MIRRLFLLYALFFMLFTGIFLWGQMKKAAESRNQMMEKLETAIVLTRSGVPEPLRKCVTEKMADNNISIDPENEAKMRKYSDYCKNRCLIEGKSEEQCTVSLIQQLERRGYKLLELTDFDDEN